MEPTKALDILKQTIDASIKTGVLPNMETATAVIQAYSVILNVINQCKTVDQSRAQV
jgi:hypothetical protein